MRRTRDSVERLVSAARSRAASTAENGPTDGTPDGVARVEALVVEQMLGTHPRRHRGLDKAAQLQLSLTYRELIAAGRPLPSFEDAEMRFYSQNGEDGIVQLLLAAVGTETRRTVEICAGDGVECNSAT